VVPALSVTATPTPDESQGANRRNQQKLDC
jgi:hypothetical protein